ncbi:MAG: tandem-95 repeat protein [Planctomycetes bacterium]|nr:tandem-95 repeat protein [Planctomycetota bacterium]
MSHFVRSCAAFAVATFCVSFPVSAQSGPIFAWGDDTYQQISESPLHTDFTNLSGGRHFALALRENGSIVAWGDDSFGQVADTPNGTGFYELAAGDRHGLALKTDGSLRSWGYNDQSVVSDTPLGIGFAQVASSAGYSLARLASGSLVIWGNTLGHLDVDLPSETDFIQISAGPRYALALHADGRIEAWGDDLGMGVIADAPLGSGFVTISAGESHALAIRSDGSLVAWGRDTFGQISNMPSAGFFTDIATGQAHSVALDRDGLVHTWGKDNYGQVSGVSTVSDVIYISSGLNFSLSIVGKYAPVANDDSGQVDEDQSILIDVMANDTDRNQTEIAIIDVQNGANGSAALESGQIRYTPNADWNGSDSFTYTISDSLGLTSTATVNALVNSIEDPPLAVKDSFAIAEDSASTQLNVLANDIDVDGHLLTVVEIGAADFGTSLLQAGLVSYQPVADWFGEATFFYTCEDPTGLRSTATITVTVDPVNDAPVSLDDAAATLEDTPLTIDALANDFDVDDTVLVISQVGSPGHGQVSNLGGAEILYTPDQHWFGTDSFSYTIVDPHGLSSSSTVVVTVSPVEDTPIANDDSFTLAEDSGYEILSVLGNDTDGDGHVLTVVEVSAADFGRSVLQNGVVAYKPDADWFGSATFSYTCQDPTGLQASAVISITVDPVNDPPVSNDDSESTTEDVPVLIDVLSNDTDVDEDLLLVTAVGAASHGEVIIVSAGAGVRYSPEAHWFGSDSFTYLCSDGAGGESQSTVFVSVSSENDAAVPEDDHYQMQEGVTPDYILIDPLSNDWDPEDDAFFLVSITSPNYGNSLNHSTAGVVYQAPDSNWYGEDEFTYTIEEANGLQSVGTIRISIANVNDAPNAQDDQALTPEDVFVAIPVLDNDLDADLDYPWSTEQLTIKIKSAPAHGLATVNGASITYLPEPDWSGADSFDYSITDSGGLISTATVMVTVSPVNDLPVASDDFAEMDEDGAQPLIDVLSNDSDPVEQSPLSVKSVSTPSHGVAQIVNGMVSYKPDADWNGTDDFTYICSDADGGEATASVQIIVSPVNDDPVAEPDFVEMDTNSGPVPIDVVLNDTDIDEDTLSLESVVEPPFHGSAIKNALGGVDYTPALNYFGVDSFRYEISDGQGGTAEGVVTVIVVKPASIVSWGYDFHSQVADTPTDQYMERVACGADHTLALDESGNLYSWGYDGFKQVSEAPVGLSFTEIAAGKSHSLAIDLAGKLHAWGDNSEAQTTVDLLGSDYVQVSAGGMHSVARDSSGTIQGWGSDAAGQLPQGNGGYSDVSAGFDFTLAIDDLGAIHHFGFSGSEVGAILPAGTDFIKVAAGFAHGLALRNDGTLVSWGNDDFRQVSDTPSDDFFVEIGVGWHHSFAITTAGRMYSWGRDDFGQQSDSPIRLGFLAVSGGRAHSASVARVTFPILSATPFVAGQTATLELSEAVPATEAYFVYSTAGPGPWDTPYDFTLDLTPPIHGAPDPLWVHLVDNQGKAFQLMPIPLSWVGAQVWLQVALLEDGFYRVSNFIEETVQ